MLKVFLVEDEYIIRESIKKTINWAAEGFSLVGEAGDGERAYPMILKSEPDIVITDIRMPFMDGLELARLIRVKLPQSRVIILSGHDEFDYAREAIQIGVTEYLLKPISGATLLTAIHGVAQKIRADQSRIDYRAIYEKEHAEKLQLERTDFFKNLVDGKLSMSQVLEQGQHFGMDLSAVWYQVMLFQVRGRDLAEAVRPEAAEADRQALEIEDTIMDLVAVQGHAEMYEQIGDTLCFLLMAQTREELQQTETSLIAKMKKAAEGSDKLLYFIGIGQAVSRLHEIKMAYQSASRAFSARFFSDCSGIFRDTDAGFLPESDQTELDLSRLNMDKLDRRIVYNFLAGGTVTDVPDFVRNYLTGLGRDNLNSLLLRQYVILDSIFAMAAFLKKQGISAAQLEQFQNQFRNFNANLTLDQAETRLCQCFDNALALRDSQSQQQYGRLIEQAKGYIDTHYACEDISLSTVAASVHFSPNHFSSIFGQQTGLSFIEYLTQVRMAKARELLYCTKLKSAEIAFQVGYRDPHYFCYVFKKTHNLTPMEFRSQRGAKAAVTGGTDACG
ncbi:response regulator [Oscillospiraceae bacterium HV4-5-C5C]|nr:response regulator [Oscillospiraceae bacterium HV4-5-C5C]